LEIVVVAGLGRQRHGACFKPVQVDVDVGRRQRAIVGLLLLRGFRVRLLVGRLRLIARLGLFRFLFLWLLVVRLLVVLFFSGIERRILVVISRRQRRLHVAPERHGNNLRRIWIGPAVIEAPVHGIELAVR